MRNYKARIQRGLAARIKAWSELPSGGGSGNSKQIDSKHSYRKPGSQNKKKSGTGHVSTGR